MGARTVALTCARAKPTVGVCERAVMGNRCGNEEAEHGRSPYAPSVMHIADRFVRPLLRIVDAAANAIMSARLRIVDLVYGPEPPTPADRQRETEEAIVNPPSRGSRVDADHPRNGVLIPCRFTGLKLTATGNLSRAVVEEMFGIIQAPDYDKTELLRFQKVIN